MIGIRFALGSVLTPASLIVTLACCGGAAFTTAAPGLDAGPPVDAGPAAEASGPFCNPDGGSFDFCSDFDEQALPAPWNNVTRNGGADIALDTDASASPPDSLLATAPALQATDAGDASVRPNVFALVTKTPLPKGGTHIAFDIRIDQLSFPNANDSSASVVPLLYTQGSDYEVILAFRPVPDGSAPFELWLIEASSTVGTAGGPTIKATALPGLLANVGVWSHVAIDFDIDHATNPGAVQGTITVTGLAPKIVTLAPPLGTALGARSLSLGINATASTGAAKLRFDNVTYTSKNQP